MAYILGDIGKIARALDSIANLEFLEFDLTRGQYLYLVRIHQNPGIIQEKLAEELRVDRTTVARSVQKLAKNGLIEKRSDPDNRKIRRLYLTENGQKIVPIILNENQYSNQTAQVGLSQLEQKQLAQLLAKVEQNVVKDWELVKKGGKRNY